MTSKTAPAKTRDLVPTSAWKGKCHDCARPLDLEIAAKPPAKTHKGPVLFQYKNRRCYGKCPRCFAARPRLARQEKGSRVYAAVELKS